MPIRPYVASDRPALKRIVELTGVFTQEEIEVALELMDASLKDREQEDYIVQTYVEENGTVRGYYCVGPTPMTETTYDLYWIAVDPNVHKGGIGTGLLAHCEKYVREEGGTLIVVETSSRPVYESTWKFYLKHQYTEAARIKDYYAPGDDLIVYTKHLFRKEV